MDKELQTGHFMFYRSEDGLQSVRVFVQDETIWLSQKQIAELFEVSIATINEHLKNIFNSEELFVDSVIRNFLITANDGKNYNVEHYNLDVIIAIGYRVNSYKATKFRQWATRTLREYLIKGFVMDDERLKQGKTLLGIDYFDELLARIAEIRASEARFYEKIRYLISLSYDYDKNDLKTHQFFAHTQNKLEYAITEKTSAELKKTRANAALPYMGLTSWSGKKKDDKIILTDVFIAKNYLLEEEISDLNRLVSSFLDYAENFVRRQKKKESPILMADWANEADRFIAFYDYPVLEGYGQCSKKMADNHAKQEFFKFRVYQDKQFLTTERAIEAIQLERKIPSEKDKIIPFEQSICKLVLVILYKKQNEFITTTQLQKDIPNNLDIPAELMQILKSRNDTKLSQHIRNLASHRNNKSSFIYKGYAVFSEKKGFQITKKGIEFVENEVVPSITIKNEATLSSYNKHLKQALNYNPNK